MKLIITVIFLALSLGTFAQNESLMQDAITKPALSLRCKDLLRERADKVKHQQRLNSLLQRNQNLIKKSPQDMQGVQTRLQSSQVRIKNEIHLTNLSVESMEESIIRSGCPGIAL